MQSRRVDSAFKSIPVLEKKKKSHQISETELYTLAQAYETVGEHYLAQARKNTDKSISSLATDYFTKLGYLNISHSHLFLSKTCVYAEKKLVEIDCLKMMNIIRDFNQGKFDSSQLNCKKRDILDLFKKMHKVLNLALPKNFEQQHASPNFSLKEFSYELAAIQAHAQTQVEKAEKAFLEEKRKWKKESTSFSLFSNAGQSTTVSTQTNQYSGLALSRHTE